MFKFIFWIIFILLFAFDFQAQAQATTRQLQSAKTESAQEKSAAAFDVKKTAAYAELLMRKTEAQADLQVLQAEYTEDSREVREKQLTVKMLDTALKNLHAMSAEKLSKLTLATGRLLARRLEAEAELKILTEIYTDEHPRVKEARIRFAVFDNEYKKIIQ